jgi:malate dehydrogenase (oxaloacetate-decarboxylating)
VIPAEDLHPEYIVPSVFNRAVAPAVAEAVAAAAVATGVARRDHGQPEPQTRAPDSASS